MVAKINHKKLIFVSLILAILIFVSGILIGITLDELRTNDLAIYLNENELQTQSYLIERQFLQTFGQDNCDIAQPRIEELSNQLSEIGETLTKYEAKGLFSGSKYSELKNKYFIFEINLYTILKELKEKCPEEDQNIVLYFYDQNQQESLNQGFILDNLVERDNVTVFSIDRNFNDQDPLVATIKTHYNITASPTIIINFKDKMEGIASLEALRQIINKEE